MVEKQRLRRRRSRRENRRNRGSGRSIFIEHINIINNKIPKYVHKTYSIDSIKEKVSH